MPSKANTVLADARAKDSHDKRRRALDAVQSLEAGGAPITFPAVARAARVSTWLVYSEGIRESVEAARRRQANSVTIADGGTAPAGLRADLALARAEIKQLRGERDNLLRRLRLQLGADIDGPQRGELICRVADLEAANRQIVAERDARDCEQRSSERRVRELEDDLTAARESLRRMIRTENAGP
jgi:hypothetical protein